MARYVCPSCGGSYNGKRCRSCNYEHFSEEIAHGGHTHKGEPLILDSPVRNPIPRKDPFGCDKSSRKPFFPKREKKQRPFAGLLTIFLLIYSFLPLVRDWGLQLEAREEARMEAVLPEDLVMLHKEGPITISTQPRYMNEFQDAGLRLWVENELNHNDVYVTTKYVTANGFVLPNSGIYIEGSADSYGMGTLYLDADNLKDACIDQVRELSLVLLCYDQSHTLLFETDPITITREISVPEAPDFDGKILLEEEGFLLESLGHWTDPKYPRYEQGWLLFYLENNTDEFLRISTPEVTLGGERVDLFFWCDLPAHSRTVVRMDLQPLQQWDFTTPSELGELTMTVEFLNPDSASEKNFTVTMPMVNTEPVVIQ